jgi:hypothetical protein
MPTLTRLVVILFLLACCIYVVMYGLAEFVEPRRVETILDVPVEQLP